MNIFKAVREKMSGKKTYLISMAIVAQQLIKVYYGDMNLYEFMVSPELTTAAEGLGLASLRAGVTGFLMPRK